MMTKRSFEAKRSEKEDEIREQLERVYKEIDALETKANLLQLELAHIENLTYEDEKYAQQER